MSQQATLTPLSLLLAAIRDPGVAKQLMESFDATVAQAGISSQEEREEFRAIYQLVALGCQAQNVDPQFLKGQLATTAKTIDTFKEGLQKTIAQIDAGFRSTMRMYQIAFYLGIALVITAVVHALSGGPALISAAFGTVGTLQLITFFFSNPPLYLQASRADLAQLQAAYFCWFTDLYNWNSFLMILGQRGDVSFESIKQVSDAVLKSTARTLSLISRHCRISPKSIDALAKQTADRDSAAKNGSDANKQTVSAGAA